MKKIPFIYIIFSTLLSFSQDNSGYYGSKFFATIESVSSTPLLYNIIENDGFDFANFDAFNYGFRLSGGYILRRNIAFEIEYGIDRSHIKNFYDTEFKSSNTSYYTNRYFNNLDINTTTILPKIQFANSKALLPLGLSHTIGIGISTSQIVDKKYEFTEKSSSSSYYSTYGSTYQNGESELTNYNLDPIKFTTFLYALNVNTSITKNILLCYGFRYSLNFRHPNSKLSTNYNTNNYSIYEKMSRHRSTNLITFTIGLTYTF